MSEIKHTNIAKYIVIILGAILFIAMFIKSSMTSFTHDESYTYLAFIHDSFMDIISFKNWYTNNHILNSLSMKYSEMIFGSSEIALRLPNLLALLIYMRYSYLLYRSQDPIITIPVFALLISNLAMIDLFSVARGYGLSFGFMIMGMYYLIEYLREPNRKYLIWFHTAAILASLSSFTMLTIYVSFLAVYNVVIFMEQFYVKAGKFEPFQINKVHIIPLLIATAILFEPVRRVLTFSKLDFGGKEGFFENTLTHVSINLTHGLGLSDTAFVVAKIVLVLIVLLTFVWIIFKLIQKEVQFFESYKGLIVSNLLLICISSIIILSHVILGADYPVARFSSFLIPLYLVHFGFLVQYVSALGNKKWMAPVMYGLALASIISFVFKFDWHTSSEWGYDMYTKNMVETLEKYHQGNYPNETDVSLGIHWLFEPATNFYRDTHQVDWLNRVDRDGFDAGDQYYYIFKDQLDELRPNTFEIIQEYAETETYLIRNLEVVPAEEIE